MSPASPSSPSTLVDLVRDRAQSHPEVAFTFLGADLAPAARLTFGALDQRARALAVALADRGVRAGDRVVFAFPPGLDAIVACFGALYAGAIAVPAPAPMAARLERSSARLDAIARDAEPAFTLTPASLAELTATRDAVAGAATWRAPTLAGDAIALIQYSSGSTGRPRGVVLGHDNVLHNLRTLAEFIGPAPPPAAHADRDAMLHWLPLHHDMGLIRGMLSPLHLAIDCALMSPFAFIQKPLSWLTAIDRQRATITGAPNFGFALAARAAASRAPASDLDLSCLRVAFCSAEPIQATTIARFTQAFAPHGFRPRAFRASYGLAEATVMVSGDRSPGRPHVHRVDAVALREGRVVPLAPAATSVTARTRELVSCGHPFGGQELAIVDAHGQRAAADRVGEVWVRGPSVARGYWRRLADTAHAFGARLAAEPLEPTATWLRTGDLGWRAPDGGLCLIGRAKDVVIVRGEKHDAHAVEATIEAAVPALRAGCSALVGVARDGTEAAVFIGELATSAGSHTIDPDLAAIIDQIRAAASEHHDLALAAVRLVAPGTVPKTASGKVQRALAGERFRAGDYDDRGALTARAAALVARDPDLAALLASPEDRAAILGRSRKARDMLEAAHERFADRIALVAHDSRRSPPRAITYAALWSHATALAREQLAARPATAPIPIGGDNTIEWVIADLACFIARRVSLPLPATAPLASFAHLLDAPTDAVADLVTIMPTSGSSGPPKGVIITDARWCASLAARLAHPPTRPVLGVIYQPLGHIAGRMAVHRTLVTGGRAHLVARGDLPALMSIIRAARPTELMLVPHVARHLYRDYLDRLRVPGADPASVMAAMREGALGDRLCELILGSAATAPEVVAFLRTCLAVPVQDSYGSTELGPVTRNGRVVPDVAWRLVDHPELGYSAADRPHARGELAVKSIFATPGYYRDPAATAALFTPDGYVRSGDIVEVRGPDELLWIDRAGDVVRLAHGEFVAPAQVEALLAAACPSIDQIYVHADPRRSFPLAVIVARPDTSVATLRAELARAVAALPTRDIPRDFILEPARFTADDGLLTDNGKPRRQALAARYAAALASLYDQHEGSRDSLAAAQSDSLMADRGRAALSSLPREPAPDAPGELLAAADLSLDRFDFPRDPPALAPSPPRTILLTGATGFLGGHLLAALLARLPPDGRVISLARRPPASHAPASDPRVTHLAADLARPRLGLAAADLARLAAEVDAIVHAGARVNHALPYRDLYAPNVAGTLELMRLALTTRAKPLHYVSTSGVAASSQFPTAAISTAESLSAAALHPTRDLAATASAAGYVTSKWAAEVLLDQLATPVVIYRAGRLLGPTTDPTAVNDQDALTLLLHAIVATRLAPTSFYRDPARTTERHLDGLPVDVAAALIAANALRHDAPADHVRYHLVAPSPNHLDLDALVADLATRHPLTRLPHAAWLAAFAAHPASTPALPLIARWAAPLIGAHDPIDNDRARELSRALLGADLPTATLAAFGA